MSYQKPGIMKYSKKDRGRSAFIVQLWWIIQSTLFSLSPQFAYNWRNFLLKIFGAKIGKNVLIRPTVRITYPWKLTIGDNSMIGDFVELYNLAEITIENDVVISQKSYICTGSHDLNKITFDLKVKPIYIKEQAWIAADVFIAQGVTIGRGTVIGIRSTVFKDMPDSMICYGNPAIAVRQRPIKKEI